MRGFGTSVHRVIRVLTLDRKSGRPAGRQPTSSTSTWSTRALGGARRSARSTRSTDSSSPSTSGLDAAIGQVAHVAVHALDSGVILHEEPEPDALHAPTDEESLRDDHENRRLSPGLPRLCNAPGRIDPGRQRVLQFADASTGREQPGGIPAADAAHRSPRRSARSARSHGVGPVRGRLRRRVPRRACRRHHSGRDAQDDSSTRWPASMQAPRSRSFGLALCQRVLDAHRQVTPRPGRDRRAAMDADGRRRQGPGPGLRCSAVPSSGPRRSPATERRSRWSPESISSC